MQGHLGCKMYISHLHSAEFLAQGPNALRLDNLAVFPKGGCIRGRRKGESKKLAIRGERSESILTTCDLLDTSVPCGLRWAVRCNLGRKGLCWEAVRAELVAADPGKILY